MEMVTDTNERKKLSPFFGASALVVNGEAYPEKSESVDKFARELR
jgi:hypothetical protein